MVETAELIVLKSINNKLQELIDIFRLKEVVGTIVKKDLADFSKQEPRVSSGKPMPEQIADYVIAAKGCNRCGGKITWDLYDKEEHPFPDHVDDDGNLCDCPEYK